MKKIVYWYKQDEWDVKIIWQGFYRKYKTSSAINYKLYCNKWEKEKSKQKKVRLWKYRTENIIYKNNFTGYSQ